MKPIEFRGTALDDLRSFPQTAMREAGYQLDRVQNGLAPDDAKAMPSIGAGVVELRIWDEAGTFRVVYVAKLADAVYVLHCFQKRTQQTAKRDIELAQKRLKAWIKEIAPGPINSDVPAYGMPLRTLPRTPRACAPARG